MRCEMEGKNIVINKIVKRVKRVREEKNLY